jgi:hypothetical protein
VRELEELERVDASTLSDGDLHHLVLLHFELESRLASLRAAHVAEWDRRRVWDADGSKAGWARLARECALSKQHAQAEVGRANKLRSMPATRAAFAEGKLSVDQVNLLTKVVHPAIDAMFARDEQILIDDLVRPHRLAEAQRHVDYWKDMAFDEVGQDRPFFNPEGRHWSAVRSFQDTVVTQGRLDPLGGTEYLTELNALEKLEFEADWAAARAEHGEKAMPAHLPRTAAQRRADAQVQMARNSRAARQGRFRQPRPLLTVLIGPGTLTRMCELANGTVLTPSQVFPLLYEADIERIVFGSPSEVIDVGVRERFFRGALRRALEVRDRYCQDESGCDELAEDCEGDHKIRFAEGGLTTQDNGRMLCSTHNRQRERKNERPPPDDTS